MNDNELQAIADVDHDKRYDVAREALDELVSPEGVSKMAAELLRLRKLVNRPEILKFIEAVKIEAAHQKERWGQDHDAAKTDDDWFWVIAYLSTKATQAFRYGDGRGGLHHLVTTAAVLANWHLAKIRQMFPDTVVEDLVVEGLQTVDLKTVLRDAEKALIVGRFENSNDFLGTGSNSRAADKEEREWNAKMEGGLEAVRKALRDLGEEPVQIE